MNYLAFISIYQWFIIIIFLSIIILPVVALIDILTSDFKGNNKIIWVIVVIFLTLPGIILYYIIGRRQKISKSVGTITNDNN